uniref:WIBG Mago-binding domain-containing protein n=1 Tax=Araucaria cunninghamii TaxID=56994 RepID=A0A0D6R617_ARACU
MGSSIEEAAAASSSSSSTSSSSALGRTLKEGERILAPTRRPDGTLRKPIRIRAGYVPQEEVAIYQSKGALMRKSMPEVPPGYDPVADAKPKTKSAKRNERKKEKKHQASIASAASERGKISENTMNGQATTENRAHKDQDIQGVAQQMGSLTVSTEVSVAASLEESHPESIDLDKRIRALKKKIRLTESQQASLAGKEILNPEQKEKLAKLDTWRKELKDLEEKKMASGS